MCDFLRSVWLKKSLSETYIVPTFWIRMSFSCGLTLLTRNGNIQLLYS